MLTVQNLPTLEINGHPIFLITKDVIVDYVRLKTSELRNENRTKICTKERALEILGCSESSLYRKLKDPNCKIKKSSVNGKFIVASLYEELEK